MVIILDILDDDEIIEEKDNPQTMEVPELMLPLQRVPSSEEECSYPHRELPHSEKPIPADHPDLWKWPRLGA